MEQVGVRELRQNLSVYLRRVAAGEALQVTERGRAVAVLAPLRQDDPLEQLVAAGRLRRPNLRLSSLGPALPTQSSVSAALNEQRDNER